MLRTAVLIGKHRRGGAYCLAALGPIRRGSALLRVATPAPSASPTLRVAQPCACLYLRSLASPCPPRPSGVVAALLQVGALRSGTGSSLLSYPPAILPPAPLRGVMRFGAGNPPSAPQGERLESMSRARQPCGPLFATLDLYSGGGVSPCERYKTFLAFCIIAYSSGSALALVSSPAESVNYPRKFFFVLRGCLYCHEKKFVRYKMECCCIVRRGCV